MTAFDELDPIPEVFPETEPATEAAAEPAAAEPQVVYTHDEESLRELREEVAALRDLFIRRLMEDKQKTELIKSRTGRRTSSPNLCGTSCLIFFSAAAWSGSK